MDDTFEEAPLLPGDDDDEPISQVDDTNLFNEDDDDENLMQGHDDEELFPEEPRHMVKMAETPMSTGTGSIKESSNSKRAKKGTGNSKGDKKKKGSAEKGQVSEFDKAMERIRMKRRKKQVSEQEAAERVQELIQKMREAADVDLTRIQAGQPAIAKLSLIDTVAAEVCKPVWSQWFLQEGLLGVIDAWLAPLPNGALPNLTLRSKILAFLARIQFSSDYAMGTGLGERLVTLWKSPEETEENRQTIRKIVVTMAKPILGVRYNNASGSSQQQQNGGEAAAGDYPSTGGRGGSSNPQKNTFRAAIPRFRARTFKVAPRSSLQRSSAA